MLFFYYNKRADFIFILVCAFSSLLEYKWKLQVIVIFLSIWPMMLGLFSEGVQKGKVR